MEKIWRPDSPTPQFLPPIISITTGTLLISLTIISPGFPSTDVLSLILATFLLTYGFGKLYGELTLDKNYIKVTETALEFREVPVLGLGWFPKTRSIKFDLIRSVDLVEVKSPLLPESHQPYLMVTTKEGKSYIIGRNYSPDQLQKIAIGLSGVTTLTNKLLGFINKTTGKAYSIEDIVNIGKNIISSLREKPTGKNQEDDSDDDEDYIIVD